MATAAASLPAVRHGVLSLVLQDLLRAVATNDLYKQRGRLAKHRARTTPPSPRQPEIRTRGSSSSRGNPNPPTTPPPPSPPTPGIALGLLDDWLSGHNPDASTRLADGSGSRRTQARLSAPPPMSLSWHATAERSPSLRTLITRHGGQRVLHNGVLALTAAVQAWARTTDTRTFR